MVAKGGGMSSNYPSISNREAALLDTGLGKAATSANALDAALLPHGPQGELQRSASQQIEGVGAHPMRVERLIIRGPARHVPDPTEWVHQFSWHGSDPQDKTRKVRDSLCFYKLRTIADQTYYNVREVRTKDDTLLTVKPMLFFQLMDIEKMLQSTHDPIADFINAACADVIAFCAALSAEEFLERSPSLNTLDTYAQLVARADGIGF